MTAVPARFVFVPGNPAPQGSKSPKGRTKAGKIILVESSKAVKPWRETIVLMARQRGGILPVGPIVANLDFVMPRPKRTAKTKPTPPALKRNGDLDKLVRAVFDAITGVWIEDDAHIVGLRATKRIAEPGEEPGVAIRVSPLLGETS